jgi:hypothetical protein
VLKSLIFARVQFDSQSQVRTDSGPGCRFVAVVAVNALYTSGLSTSVSASCTVSASKPPYVSRIDPR